MKESIAIFSTTWGSRYGGIDSFNYDLCVALANLLKSRRPGLELVCILSEDNSTEEEIQAADSLGIEHLIIPANISNKFLIPFLQNKIKPIYVLGHDVHTGQRAIDLAIHYKVKSAVFHHMNYQAYRSDQDAIRKQKNILRKADFVFAIGPTLEDSAKSIMTGFKDEGCVTQIIPGISQRQSIATKPPPNFSAITLGRVNLENDLIKQIQLAVASFGRAVFEEPHTIKKKQPSLTVIGVSEEDLESAQKLFQGLAKDKAQRRVLVTAWPYERDRKVLFDELRGKTVCMVLSWYEGFSLVGLEAISAGVPLILSENTGLYNAIKKDLEGEGLGCIKCVDISADEELSEKDLSQVASCLREIASEPETAKSNAIKLREKLAKIWTWEETARQVLSKLDFKEKTLELIEDASSSRTLPENSLNDEIVNKNNSGNLLLSDSSTIIRFQKKVTNIQNISNFLPTNSRKDFSGRKEDDYASQSDKVSTLVPKEIISVYEKLLEALRIAKTLKESEVISEAYSQYLSSNRFITSEILKLIEEMNFQVDLTWWNTALKLSRNISANYDTSLKTIKGLKITNQGKWHETHQELSELKNHFQKLFRLT